VCYEASKLELISHRCSSGGATGVSLASHRVAHAATLGAVVGTDVVDEVVVVGAKLGQTVVAHPGTASTLTNREADTASLDVVGKESKEQDKDRTLHLSE